MIKLNGIWLPEHDWLEYRGRVLISRRAMEAKRSTVGTIAQAEMRALALDMETSVMEDWDEIHKEPIEDLVKVLEDLSAAQRDR